MAERNARELYSFILVGKLITGTEMYEVSSDGNSCSKSLASSSRDADDIHFSCSST
jgi:hypothetical protein